MERETQLFLVWQGAENDGFYNQYFTLEEAVKNEDSGAEIFKADMVSLGQFELVTKCVKKSKPKGKK
jgi:hypothetical protein